MVKDYESLPESFADVNPLDPVVAVGFRDSDGSKLAFPLFFLIMK